MRKALLFSTIFFMGILIVSLSGEKIDVSNSTDLRIIEQNLQSDAKKDPNYDTDVLNIEWVRIPAGEFTMGDNYNDDLERSRPAHAVYLDEYYMSKYEITFDQFDHFFEQVGWEKTSDAGWGRGNRPAINVSWLAAWGFCDWLSDKTGKNIHLASEAQWEKAARGTDLRRYPWGNDPPTCELENHMGCNGKTMPVGSYPLGVSPYGLFDMGGNVYEWCQDWQGPDYYTESTYYNPQGPGEKIGNIYHRVLRGGSCCDPTHHTRTYQRPWSVPEDRRYDNFGFRVVMEVGRGRNYYVSPAGNDSNLGTLDQPWKTIQHAVNSVGAGDTVWIRGGTYNEQIKTVRHGNNYEYITFTAYPGETPLIDGTGVTSSEFYFNGFEINHSYIRVHGLELSNWERAIEISYTGGWVILLNVKHIEISDCVIHDVEDYGIYANRDSYSNDVEINRCRVYNSPTGFYLGSKDISLNSCSAHDNKTGFFINSENATLDNCIGYHNEERNLYITGTGGIGGTDKLSRATLKNCTFFDSAINVKLTDLCESLTMYNCILAGGDSKGMEFEDWDTTIYQGDYNVFHNDNANSAISDTKNNKDFSLSQILSGDWTAYSGQDQHSLVSNNPNTDLFVNMANGDLHLRQGSKAIDAGASENMPLIDFDGNLRPVGSGIDIGAYEYGASLAPGLSLSETSFKFDSSSGQVPSPQNFLISNTGGNTLDWAVTDNADWLSCSPTSGTGDGTVTVSVDPSSVSALSANTTYNFAKITVSSTKASNSPKDIYVTLDATASTPQISVSRKRINFGTFSDKITSSQIFRVENSGVGTLNWSISEDADWLSCTPSSGSGNAVITTSVDPAGFASGTYNGTITVSSANATNSPQTLSATLNVYGEGTSSPPFGVFATPTDGSTVSSSIPVTGWALDDIGVESVKIYREEGGSLIYIGDAVFVEGARADIEQAYPDYPMNYRAGWGYMLLTNFLPNSGNGTFPLQAFAIDKEGNSVYLGTKTITCDNANAVKPFGAIDTPTQGGTASGSAFVNFGWVLTPMPNEIPTDGSTIDVYVNGVNLGHPVYNNYREDIANNFPGYANSDGAVGYFYLDTTPYTDGVHTIAWTAKDNAGNMDGIGSRYFSVQNSGSSINAQVRGRSQRKALDIPLSFESVMNLPVSFEPIRYKRGFKRDKKSEIAVTDNYGISTIEIREVERIEILLNHELSAISYELSTMSYEPSTMNYLGYMIVGTALRPLPIGSTLDTENGIFSWQLGPGFIGDYDFVFIIGETYGVQRKAIVRIRIVPKFSQSDFVLNEYLDAVLSITNYSF